MRGGQWLMLAIAGGILLPLASAAEKPPFISYQGQAVDLQGVPLEGSHALTFRLYDAEQGGQKLWEETHVGVPLDGGRFTVLLGQVTPFEETDWSRSCWLSLQVGTDPELTPRQLIVGVPRAWMTERPANSNQSSPHNLLVNGSFETWSQPPPFPPDGWDVGGYGDAYLVQNVRLGIYGKRAVDLTNREQGGGAARQVVVPTISDVQNAFWRGKTLTFSAVVKSALAGCVQLCLGDGAEPGPSCSTPHSGSDRFETLSVTHAIRPHAVHFHAFLWLPDRNPATVVTMDGAMLVEGPMPVAFSPKPVDPLGPGRSFEPVLADGALADGALADGALADGVLVLRGDSEVPPPAPGMAYLWFDRDDDEDGGSLNVTFPNGSVRTLAKPKKPLIWWLAPKDARERLRHGH